MTTDVSRRPLFDSVIQALVDYGIEVGAESRSIDMRRAGRCLGERRAEHEPPWPDGPQFRNRRAVAGYDYRAAGLYFTKYGCGLVAKLTLRDDSVHAGERSTCSTL
jgi:hypothetical protein